MSSWSRSIWPFLAILKGLAKYGQKWTFLPLFDPFKAEFIKKVFFLHTTNSDSSRVDIKMISAQHSSNNGKNWQKLSYQKILLAW